MLIHFFQKEYTVIIKTFSNHFYRIVSWSLHYIISLTCSIITMSWISPQLSAQTFSTTCLEFILPFLVSDYVSYFVCLCMWYNVFLSTKIGILATINKSRTEYANLLTVITAETFSTTCLEFILPFLVSDHVSYFVCVCDVMYSSLHKLVFLLQ